MIKEIGDLLARDDKNIDAAKNPGAVLFRQIAFDLNLTPEQWDQKIRDYLETTEGGSFSKNKRSSERNNINRSLIQNRTTWKKLRRAISILKPKEVKFTLEMEWDPKLEFGNNPPTSVSIISKGRYDDLYYLYRKVWNSIIDSIAIWDNLVNRWIDKLDDATKDNPADRSTEKGNIQKTILRKNTLTIALFCKALNILGVEKATLIVHLKWNSKKTTLHRYVFDTFKESTNGD
jgi:hypothetical protein